MTTEKFSTLDDLTQAAELHGFTITPNTAFGNFDIKGHGITGVIQCDRSYPDNEAFWWASIELDEEMWGVCGADGESHSANISADCWHWMTSTHGHPAEFYFGGIQSLLVRMSRMCEFFS